MSVSVLTGLQRGFRRRCPNCGQGRLFKGYLKVNPTCPSCGHANGLYRADDAPRYKRGNGQLVALVSANIVIYILVKVYYVLRNRSRDKKWNAMTPDERQHYLDTTTDEGNKRLDFRFAH